MPGRENLRLTFDEAADLYDRIRPGYPERLFEDLVELGHLGPNARVLEIGCGTGQATVSLARRGYEIVCIELGEALSTFARRRLALYPKVRVVTSPFETWNADCPSFDLVFAATSWHWLDPDRRYVKAASLLKETGRLAIVTTHHVLPDDGDRFFVEIQDAYNAIGEERLAAAASRRGRRRTRGHRGERAVRRRECAEVSVGQVVYGGAVPRPSRHLFGPSFDGSRGASSALRRDPAPYRLTTRSLRS
jgi:SAM-dependent methyltransferase